MPLIPLAFIAFFGGTYIFSTIVLRQGSHLHDSKLVHRAYRR